MHFRGFEIEVLVNNVLLDEYRGPRNSVPYRYTSPNWVDNEKTRVRNESPYLHYIAFRTVPTYFTVRVSSTDTTYQRPLRVLIKIDGISPPNYPTIDLYGVEKKQQNYVVNNNPKLVGAISAYFYPTISSHVKSNVPVALLHLHYRSVDELRQWGFNVPLDVKQDGIDNDERQIKWENIDDIEG
ncbi:19155_t:CDS:2 [Dentiscutata erythropus]|uniref:19155_t:CDS:1 n=1 Tax=Dentiscutata erythropus TaxID=1348616 RepID=A0A9N9FQP2_9GLOM|nr:19155_t:CDS:2 [Dentiscutata erythropus]